MGKLTEREICIIGECLRAVVEGPFFRDEGADDPFWEFHSLFGITREELARVAAKWPDVECQEESVTLAVNNSLNNLLSYPHGHEEEWSGFISVPADEVTAVFKSWRKQEC